jgi:hypothetical protein
VILPSPMDVRNHGSACLSYLYHRASGPIRHPLERAGEMTNRPAWGRFDHRWLPPNQVLSRCEYGLKPPIDGLGQSRANRRRMYQNIIISEPNSDTAAPT